MCDNKKRCFIISPIGAPDSDIRRHADAVREFIIHKAFELFEEETGVTVKAVRSDEICDSGSISERMFEEILGADLCVAVLTGLNPNVFYELAVAQSAARPVILLLEKGETIPFDVRDLRYVEYELGDICELVGGKYAREMQLHLQAIHCEGWSSRSLFEHYGYGRQQRFEQQLRDMVLQARPEPLEAGVDGVYRMPGSDRRLVLVTGDVVKLADMQSEIQGRGLPPVHVIVSLVDVNMQPARFFDTSIPGALSGTLRYMDAKRSEAGEVERDSLVESLNRTLESEGVTLPAPLGLVLPTPTTQLREDGVRYVFQVSAMTGSVGGGYRMMDDLIDDCVCNVYRRFRALPAKDRLESILFPLIGAAATPLEPEEIAGRLLRPITRQMTRTEGFPTTFILAWLESHRFALEKAVKELVELGKLEPVEDLPEQTAPIRAAA